MIQKQINEIIAGHSDLKRIRGRVQTKRRQGSTRFFDSLEMYYVIMIELNIVLINF